MGRIGTDAGGLDLAATPDRCPHCASSDWTRWGFKRAVQRYRCKSCGRTFNSRTGTRYARVWHLEERMQFTAGMSRVRPLRADANSLGVSVATVFRWRHQELALLAEIERKRLQSQCFQNEVMVRQARFWSQHRYWSKGEWRRRLESWQREIDMDYTPPVITVCFAATRVEEPVHGSEPDAKEIAILAVRHMDELVEKCRFQVGTIVHVRTGSLEVKPADAAIGGGQLRLRRRFQRRPSASQFGAAFRLESRFGNWMTRFFGVAMRYLDRYVAWFMYLGAQTKRTNT